MDWDWSDKKETKLDKLLEALRSDCVDQKTYEEIYSMIPEDLICEKDRNMWSEEVLWFETRCTKRFLSKKVHKEIIQKLQWFASDKNLTKNQLRFNNIDSDTDVIYIRTIYKPN